MPWITSIGLMTFPSDLLIFRPCESRTMLWNNTYSRQSNEARTYSYRSITDWQTHRVTIVRRSDGRMETWWLEEVGRGQTEIVKINQIYWMAEIHWTTTIVTNPTVLPYIQIGFITLYQIWFLLSHFSTGQGPCFANLHNSKHLPNPFFKHNIQSTHVHWQNMKVICNHCTRQHTMHTTGWRLRLLILKHSQSVQKSTQSTHCKIPVIVPKWHPAITASENWLSPMTVSH